MSNILDAELGKTLGVRRTKGGAGDKQEAFLIRGTLFKGALLCCLLVAVVGGLAIFVSQWEVSFQRKINLLERSEHATEETESYERLMEVGNFLANFLRTETNEKMEASLVNDLVQSEVKKLMVAIDKAKDSSEIQVAVDRFGALIYTVLEEYNHQIESESAAAKDLLKQINGILADEKMLPHHHREEDENGRQRPPARRPPPRRPPPRRPPSRRPDSRREREDTRDERRPAREPAFGPGLNKTITRFFDRFQLLDTLEIPEEILDELEQLISRENWPSLKDEGKAQQFFEDLGFKVKALLSSPGVEGVDVSMQLPGRAVIGTVREILAAMKVKANRERVQQAYDRWKSGRFSDGVIMHALHALARERIVPFDWVVGDNMLQRGDRSGEKRPVSFADTKNWWWKALAEKEGKKPIRHLPFGLKFPNQRKA